jgi:hypothetical protein
MVYHIGYVSTQTALLGPNELLGLLEAARARNRGLGLTGVLLHREDSFFQVLEGDASSVRQVFDSIQRDRRHQRVEILFEGEIEAREFAEWQMGFAELDGVDVSSLPGFSDFLVNKEDEPRRLFYHLSKAKRLMLLFRALK